MEADTLPGLDAKAQRSKVAEGVAAAHRVVAEWLTVRAELRAIEEAEHPPITDALGRTWIWRDGDLYAHDGMAWPREYVERPDVGLPTRRALDNPNYRWCGICRGESVQVGGRRVPVVTVQVAEGRL